MRPAVLAGAPARSPRRTLSHLEQAVRAVELRDALELVAQQHVARAQTEDGATWEQIGAAFSTTPQSAHERFRNRNS